MLSCPLVALVALFMCLRNLSWVGLCLEAVRSCCSGSCARGLLSNFRIKQRACGSGKHGISWWQVGLPCMWLTRGSSPFAGVISMHVSATPCSHCVVQFDSGCNLCSPGYPVHRCMKSRGNRAVFHSYGSCHKPEYTIA